MTIVQFLTLLSWFVAFLYCLHTRRHAILGLAIFAAFVVGILGLWLYSRNIVEACISLFIDIIIIFYVLKDMRKDK